MPKNYNLYIKGDIGWDSTPDMVSYVLDKYSGREVNVLVDSLGGRVDAALSISSLFRVHGNVHCHYVGMSASAATILSMGAKHISMDAHALYLVHKCMNLVLEWDYFNADELQEHIEELKKMKNDQETIDGCIAGLYAQRCKRSKEELLALMKEGAWLTAQQALEWGFIDEITDAPDDEEPVLTQPVAAVLAQAGIPMPPINLKKDSPLDKLVEFLSSLFNKKTAAATVASAPAEPAKPSPIMDKFAKILALLGVTALSADDEGNLLLSEEQSKVIDDRLEAADQEISELTAKVTDKDARIAELEAKVADLTKEPAAQTTEVVDETKDAKDAFSPSDDVYADAQNIMRQLL